MGVKCTKKSVNMMHLCTKNKKNMLKIRKIKKICKRNIFKNVKSF